LTNLDTLITSLISPNHLLPYLFTYQEGCLLRKLRADLNGYLQELVFGIFGKWRLLNRDLSDIDNLFRSLAVAKTFGPLYGKVILALHLVHLDPSAF
jgi:hypothetical protein